MPRPVRRRSPRCRGRPWCGCAATGRRRRRRRRAGAAIVKPAHRSLATSTNQPSTGIGLLSLIASVRPRAQMNVASVAMIALSPSLATRNPWNRPMTTPTPMAASTAIVNEERLGDPPEDHPLQRQHRADGQVDVARDDRERQRYGDQREGGGLRHHRLDEVAIDPHRIDDGERAERSDGEGRQHPQVGAAASRSRQLHRAPRRSRRSTTTASRRTPPIIACWRFGGTPRIVW